MTSSSFPLPRSDSANPDPAYAFKGEARQLRADARTRGQELSQSAALEQVAHAKGFRDWNALSAHVARSGGLTASSPPVFPWQQVDQPLPQLPLQALKPQELRRHESIAELMRWARQLEFIADKVAPEHRPESMELIGNRVPYVLEQSRSRWPDGLFHLCDRGYEAFKGVMLAAEQVRSLGLPEWNEAHGHHGGGDTFTVLGDDWRRIRNADMLKRMARLLASIALVGEEAPAED